MSVIDTLTPEAFDDLSKSGEFQEGAWTGSMGGHDPDFMKLKGGLHKWAVEMVAKEPHPFRAMVAALRNHFPHPERLVAWLIDQVKQNTHWRNGGGKGGIKESVFDNYLPTLGELRRAWEAVQGMNAPTSVQEAASSKSGEVVEITFGPQGRVVKYADGTSVSTATGEAN